MKKEENKHSSKKVNLQMLMRKRWLLPAVYLLVAAGLLSAVFFTQNGEESADPDNTPNEVTMDPNGSEDPSVPVVTGDETLHMPVEDEAEYKQVGYFYDADADVEEQQKALVFYSNVYRQNQGIDLQRNNGERFSVTAAMSGKVIKATKDSILGYVVEIDHGDDIVTHYSSLNNVDVSKGDQVKQGQVLGMSGSNEYNMDAGVHVHFEIRKEGTALNPNDAFGKSLARMADLSPSDKKETDDDEANVEGKDEETKEDPSSEQPEMELPSDS
ncbi:M23 family metallopeptidase [Bacillus sp. FSL W7-1360]